MYNPPAYSTKKGTRITWDKTYLNLRHIRIRIAKEEYLMAALTHVMHAPPEDIDLMALASTRPRPRSLSA